MKSSKNIIILIDSLGSGGAQNQATLLASGLGRSNYNVLFVTYFNNNFFLHRLKASNVRHMALEKKGKFGFNLLKDLVRIIDANNIDTIISFLDTSNFYAVTLKLLRWRIKIITSFRSSSKLGIGNFLSTSIKSYIVIFSDFVVFNSVHERLNFLNYYKLYDNKFITIYNAVDLKNWHVYDEPEFPDSLICVGSIGEDKNGLILIEALNIFKKRYDAIKIKIVWVSQNIEHLPQRKEYLTRMKEKIDVYNLQDNWEWRLAYTQINEDLGKYRALVLPSVKEGLPNTVCEALSASIPCIVSNVLDHPILISAKERGFLFDPNSVEELVDSINSLYNLKSDEYNTMKKKCREYAENNLSYEFMLSKFENILI